MIAHQRILSPLRLPFRHIGVRQQASLPRSAFLQAQNGYFEKQRKYQLQYWQLLLYRFGRGFRHWLGTIGFDPAWLQTAGMSALINFSSKYRDFLGRLDSDLYRIAVDPGHFDMDKITDNDALVYLSG
jgi:hypothetical protein